MKPMLRSPRVAFWALAGVTLLLSHDAVWLVQLGPGRDVAAALRESQHGYWAAASVALLLAAAVTATVIGTSAIQLVSQARRMDVVMASVPGRRFARRAARAWIGLLAVVGVAFALQENAEHFIRHGHVLGVGAITGPEYPLAIPVIAAVTGIAAVIWASVAAVGAELVAGIAAAALRRRFRAPRSVRRTTESVSVRRRPAMAGSDAGRAPPLLVGT